MSKKTKAARRVAAQAATHARTVGASGTKAVQPARRIAQGFEAGKLGRRLRAIPTTLSAINTQIRLYGANVVARSRYLAANNPYASAAKEEFVSAMVGCGIKPSPLINDPKKKKQVVALWKRWTDEADADGLTDFYGLQSIVAAEMFEAGECFIRKRPRYVSDGLSVPFQLQILPSEMLDTSHNQVLSSGRGRIEMGIEFDAIGRRTAYWFWTFHPGEMTNLTFLGGALTKVRVPASEVLHLFKPIRAGQIRGLPHTLAGMITLAMIDLYDDAELERKRIAALFGAFVTRPKNETAEEHPLSGTEETDAPVSGFNAPSNFTLEPGAVVDLAEGQEIKFSEPVDVGSTYEAFQYRNLLRAAAGFGGTYAGMTGDLRATSYGSIRAGLIAFRRRVEAQQHHVMVFQLCRPVWAWWWDYAMTSGGLPLISFAEYGDDPWSFQNVKWIPPKWEWIDPLKDRQAEKLAVDSGFKPRSEVIEAEGYDPEENDERIAADQARAGVLGIKFITLASSVIVSGDDEDESLVDSTVPSSDSADFG